MKQWAVILHIDAEDDYTKADLIDAMGPTFLPPGVQLADIEVMPEPDTEQLDEEFWRRRAQDKGVAR